MPHSSSHAADPLPTLRLTHAAQYNPSEARALAALLGLPDTTLPLILPMLWLGKSDLSRALHEQVGTRHFALQEAQEFHYTRTFRDNEHCTAHITMQRDADSDPVRLLITADFMATDSTPITTLKSTIRLVEKPKTPQPLSAAAPKERAMGPIDLPLPVIDQEMINRYAALSGDDNPVHLDPAAARALGLTDTIAHGMMVMGLAQQALTPPYATLTHDVFPLRFSCRFLLPLTTGRQAGISVKHHANDGRVSERLTVLSEAGPHAMVQIQYQTL